MGNKSECVIGCKDAIDMQGCHKNIFSAVISNHMIIS